MTEPQTQRAGQVKTVCPYCGVGCGMILHVEDGRVVRVSGDKAHPANFGSLCTKGSTVDQTIRAPGRLTHAQRRRVRPGMAARGDEPPDFERVPMDTALQMVADGLRAVMDEHGPDAVALYVSGQLSTETQYVANKLCKGFIGTNNIESNSRLCMASAASGYKLSLGADAPPGHYEDFEAADLFFVIGSNMADCHPILHQRMKRRLREGARLIVADPRRTATAAGATLYLPVRPGSDLALLNGLLHLLMKMGAGRCTTSSPAHTEGWDELVRDARRLPARARRRPDRPDRGPISLEAARLLAERAAFDDPLDDGPQPERARAPGRSTPFATCISPPGGFAVRAADRFSLTGQPNAMGGREVGYMSGGLPGQRSVHDARDRAETEALWGSAREDTLRARPGLPGRRFVQGHRGGQDQGACGSSAAIRP